MMLEYIVCERNMYLPMLTLYKQNLMVRTYIHPVHDYLRQQKRVQSRNHNSWVL